MPSPRFRLRTLMIVVALTALGLTGEITRRRVERLSSQYRSRASEWRRKASIAGFHAFKVNLHIKNRRPPDPDLARLAEGYFRQAEFFRAMDEKYKQAAARPWLPVAPDRPEPK